MGKAKRVRMFQVGAAAVEKLTGQAGVYLCPICGGPFDEHAAEEAELTEEHVPPRSLGGRAIALTCRGCNSRAGYTAEAALKNREESRGFVELMQGLRHDYDRDVGIELGGTEVRAKVERDPVAKRLTFRVLGETNDPLLVGRAATHLRDLAASDDATGHEFRVHSRVRYDPRLAQVAELKAAFLAAFAVFGYRYALSPALIKVRKQIWAPTDHVLDAVWTMDLDTEREFLVLLSSDPECLAVKMRRSWVVLPWVTSPESFYDELPGIGGEGGTVRLTGTPVPWPTGLQLLLDGLEEGPREP